MFERLSKSCIKIVSLFSYLSIHSFTMDHNGLYTEKSPFISSNSQKKESYFKKYDSPTSSSFSSKNDKKEEKKYNYKYEKMKYDGYSSSTSDGYNMKTYISKFEKEDK